MPCPRHLCQWFGKEETSQCQLAALAVQNNVLSLSPPWRAQYWTHRCSAHKLLEIGQERPVSPQEFCINGIMTENRLGVEELHAKLKASPFKPLPRQDSVNTQQSLLGILMIIIKTWLDLHTPDTAIKHPRCL